MALPPNIDEAEFLSSQRVVGAVNAMLTNPAARKLLLQARKITDPNAVIPEIDAAEPINREVAELKKMIAEDAAARAKEREEEQNRRVTQEFAAKVQRQKDALRSRGWNDEGIGEIEKFALENAVPDLEIAASHWEKLHPPPLPAQPSGSGSWNFFDGQQAENDETFVKAMIESKGDDEGALNREIQAALSDVRGQQQPARR